MASKEHSQSALSFSASAVEGRLYTHNTRKARLAALEILEDPTFSANPLNTDQVEKMLRKIEWSWRHQGEVPDRRLETRSLLKSSTKTNGSKPNNSHPR